MLRNLDYVPTTEDSLEKFRGRMLLRRLAVAEEQSARHARQLVRAYAQRRQGRVTGAQMAQDLEVLSNLARGLRCERHVRVRIVPKTAVNPGHCDLCGLWDGDLAEGIGRCCQPRVGSLSIQPRSE